MLFNILRDVLSFFRPPRCGRATVRKHRQKSLPGKPLKHYERQDIYKYDEVDLL